MQLINLSRNSYGGYEFGPPPQKKKTVGCNFEEFYHVTQLVATCFGNIFTTFNMYMYILINGISSN